MANKLQFVKVENDYKRNENLYDYIKNKIIEIDQDSLDIKCFSFGENSIMELKEKIERNGKSLKEWNVRINRGVLTGFNEAFIINTEKRNEILSNCQDEEERKRTEDLIKPVLRGRDIGKYSYKWAGLWLINSHNGYKNVDRIDIKNDYQAVYDHCLNYQEQCEKRLDKGKHWTNLRNCAYLEDFEGEKIIYGQFRKGSFAFNNKHNFISSNEYIIVSKNNNLKYLISILNSKIFYYYSELTMNSLSGATTIAQKNIVIEFPIPVPTQEQENILTNFVDKILSITSGEDYEKNADLQ